MLELILVALHTSFFKKREKELVLELIDVALHTSFFKKREKELVLELIDVALSTSFLRRKKIIGPRIDHCDTSHFVF